MSSAAAASLAAPTVSAPLTASALSQVPSLSGDTPVPSPPSSISGQTHVDSKPSSLFEGRKISDLEKAEAIINAPAVVPDFPEGGARAYCAVAGATIVMATTFGMSNSL